MTPTHNYMKISFCINLHVLLFSYNRFYKPEITSFIAGIMYV